MGFKSSFEGLLLLLAADCDRGRRAGGMGMEWIGWEHMRMADLAF
jgi:hypothetical protein